MDLSKILSISGKPGLYQVVSQAKNAVIVESLPDKKRFPAFGNEKISSLEEISIYTTGEDLPLKELLKTLFGKLEGKPAPDPKSDPAKLKDFFLEAVPEYDQERVYLSDIKKILNWYNILLENDLLDFTTEEEPAGDNGEASESNTDGEPEKENPPQPLPETDESSQP